MNKAKAYDDLKADLERWVEGGPSWDTPTEWEMPGILLVLELLKCREEQA
jgi:hypothetical protein